MLTENQFGVVFDVIHFPSEVKKKIIQLRNLKILNGQENFTCTDTVVYAINCAHQLEMVMSKKIAESKKPANTPDASEGINKSRPDLSNRIKKD